MHNYKQMFGISKYFIKTTFFTTTKQSFKFSNSLPRGSKFSDEFGLTKEFNKIQKSAKNYEESTVFGYSAIIFGWVSVLGFMLLTIALDEEKRSMMRLIGLKFERTFKKGNEEKLIRQVQLHQKKFAYLSQESFFMNILVKQCIEELKRKEKDEDQMVDEIMRYEIKKYKNYKQISQNSRIMQSVTKYMQVRVKIKKYQNNSDMKQIMQFCLKYGKPSLMFLAVRIAQKENPSFLRQTNIKALIREKQKLEKAKIQEEEKKLEQFQFLDVNAEGIRYCLELDKQFLSYIEKSIQN